MDGRAWTVKKYIDDVFTAGHGSLYANDGRTRSDHSQKYGSGGLVHGKQYMLSLTWNAPQQAFDDPSDFFEGKGVDAVYFPFHKANQFLGMTGLPTFLAVDVMKRRMCRRRWQLMRPIWTRCLARHSNFFAWTGLAAGLPHSHRYYAGFKDFAVFVGAGKPAERPVQALLDLASTSGYLILAQTNHRP